MRMSHCWAHEMEWRSNGPIRCQCHILSAEPLSLPEWLKSQWQEILIPPQSSLHLELRTTTVTVNQPPCTEHHILHTSSLIVLRLDDPHLTSEEVELREVNGLPRPHSRYVCRAKQEFQCKPTWFLSPQRSPFPDSGSCIPALHLL